jgi:hypothetical protein
METRKETTESDWSQFVSAFEEYTSSNPFDELEEMYLSPSQRSRLYKEAAAELKAKIQGLREHKKQKEK